MVIQADVLNTSSIIIGDSSVLFASRNGIILAPGEAASFENLAPSTSGHFYDLNTFFFDGGTTGDAIIVTRIVGN